VFSAAHRCACLVGACARTRGVVHTYNNGGRGSARNGDSRQCSARRECGAVLPQEPARKCPYVIQNAAECATGSSSNRQVSARESEGRCARRAYREWYVALYAYVSERRRRQQRCKEGSAEKEDRREGGGGRGERRRQPGEKRGWW